MRPSASSPSPETSCIRQERVQQIMCPIPLYQTGHSQDASYLQKERQHCTFLSCPESVDRLSNHVKLAPYLCKEKCVFDFGNTMFRSSPPGRKVQQFACLPWPESATFVAWLVKQDSVQNHHILTQLHVDIYARASNPSCAQHALLAHTMLVEHTISTKSMVERKKGHSCSASEGGSTAVLK